MRHKLRRHDVTNEFMEEVRKLAEKYEGKVEGVYLIRSTAERTPADNLPDFHFEALVSNRKTKKGADKMVEAAVYYVIDNFIKPATTVTPKR